MKRLLFIIIFLLVPSISMAGPPGSPPQKTVTFEEYTVATLPALSSVDKVLAFISDGADATDCTVGGGSDLNMCRWNGSAWVNAGDGTAAGSAEVQNEAMSVVNFSGDTTHAPSQDAIHDWAIIHDTDMDGDVDVVDATVWATKQDLLVDSAGLAAALDDETGTGVAVYSISPTLVTPTIGVATATSVAVDTEVYGVGWNADLTVATKDAIYDKVESLAGGHDAVTLAAGTNALVLATQEISIDATVEQLADLTPTNNAILGFDGSGNLENKTSLNLAFDSSTPEVLLRDDDAIGAADADEDAVSIKANMSTATEDAEVADWWVTYHDAGTERASVFWDASDWAVYLGVMTDAATPAAVAGYERLKFDFNTGTDNQAAVTTDSGLTEIDIQGITLKDDGDDYVHEGTETCLPPVILAEPDSLQPISDAWPLYTFPAEQYESGFTITAIHIWSSAADIDALNFEEWSNNGTAWNADATIEAITMSGVYTQDDGTLTDSSIAADASIFVDLATTPTDVAWIKVMVCGNE